jgi:mRNA interferase RelE/StbE
MHKIVFATSAAKQLKQINISAQKTIVEKIKKLDLSHPNNNIKKIVGSADLYRLRVGDYRVVYKIIKKELIVLVLKVGHRKDVYREIYKL